MTNSQITTDLGRAAGDLVGRGHKGRHRRHGVFTRECNECGFTRDYTADLIAALMCILIAVGFFVWATMS